MSSSDESDDSSHDKRKHKKDSVDRRKEEKSSSKNKSDKKKSSKKDRDDSPSRHQRDRSTERKHEKKSKKSKKRRSSSSDSDSPETPKRNALSSEAKRSEHKEKREKDYASGKSGGEPKRPRDDRAEKEHRFSSGSTPSGDYDDSRKKSSYPPYKKSRDNDDFRERSDRRGDHRQQYGPSDRSKGYNNRREKTPPWKRRRDEDDAEKQQRPAWATNRVIEHAEQIQKRKLLWQRPSATAPTSSTESIEDAPSTSKTGPAASSSSSGSSTNWANMLAASGSDEKSIDKFKRLMGIRGGGGGGDTTAVSSDAVQAERSRQETLYRDLDQQYNIARSVTHTGRGKGLGFL